MRLCTAPGCTKKYSAQGYCQMHYARLRKHGSVDLPKREKKYPSDKCSVEGCDGARAAMGWCSMHYNRWREHGELGPVGRIEKKEHYAGVRGSTQSPEHVQKRIAATMATLRDQTRECIRCAAEFTPQTGAQKYCSIYCYDRTKAQRNQRVSESRRLKISRTLRRDLLEKQGHKCAICGTLDPGNQGFCAEALESCGAIRRDARSRERTSSLI